MFLKEEGAHGADKGIKSTSAHLAWKQKDDLNGYSSEYM